MNATKLLLSASLSLLASLCAAYAGTPVPHGGWFASSTSPEQKSLQVAEFEADDGSPGHKIELKKTKEKIKYAEIGVGFDKAADFGKFGKISFLVSSNANLKCNVALKCDGGSLETKFKPLPSTEPGRFAKIEFSKDEFKVSGKPDLGKVAGLRIGFGLWDADSAACDISASVSEIETEEEGAPSPATADSSSKPSQPPGKTALKKGMRIAIAGDSITQQRMYSRFIELYFAACHPELDIHVMQFGWDGERVPGFEARMDSDLLPFKPDIVTLCYGMNDGSYRAYDAAIGKTYGDALARVVERLKASGIAPIVGGPGAVDTRYYGKGAAGAAQTYNGNLAKLSEIAGKLAKEKGLVFVDVHSPMTQAMSKAKAALGADYDVCGKDGVHPGPNGHLVMACAFLKAFDVDGQIGTVTIDMKGGASASEGHKVLSAQGGRVELESSRHPFCFSAAEAGILPYADFNQELNRFTLVVKNLPGESARVSWGKKTKTFTREQLERGVNLAAEFVESPFCESFGKLDSLVRSKQSFETFLVKSFFHGMPAVLKDSDGETAAELNAMKEKLRLIHASLEAKEKKSLTPVRHAIVIR